MLLNDVGTEVTKIEPLGSDTTHALGSGSEFFRMFNRNRKSAVRDLKSVEGVEAALRLIGAADVVSESLKSGVLEKLGLGYEVLKQRNPCLIYVGHNGFLQPHSTP